MKLGSGAGLPETSMSKIKFANIAIKKNEGYSGDAFELGTTSLGIEWRYYKRELEKQRREKKKEAKGNGMNERRPTDRPFREPDFGRDRFGRGDPSRFRSRRGGGHHR